MPLEHGIRVSDSIRGATNAQGWGIANKRDEVRRLPTCCEDNLLRLNKGYSSSTGGDKKAVSSGGWCVGVLRKG